MSIRDQVRRNTGIVQTIAKTSNSGGDAKYIDLLLEELKKSTSLFAERPNRADMTLRLREMVTKIPEIPANDSEKICRSVLDHLYGYGLIQELMDDPQISDIQINGDQYIRYTKHGERHVYHRRFQSNDDVLSWVESKLKGTPFTYDRSTARRDAYLADGSRLHIKGEVVGVQTKLGERFIIKPTLAVTIRKFGAFMTLEQLAEKGLLSQKAHHYLHLSSLVGDSFVLSGGTGSGKTTLMNALVSLSNPLHQIAILEEAPEMQPRHDFVTRMWERPEAADSVGKGIYTDTNLIDSLRMFFDELYVGEIRTPKMGYQFLQAAENASGRVGTTIHAKSANGALRRLMNLATSAPEPLGENAAWDNIQNSIRLVIQMDRKKGQRRVTEIMEVATEYEGRGVALTPVFTFEWGGLNETGLPDGKLLFHGLTDEFQKKCASWGLAIPQELRVRDV